MKNAEGGKKMKKHRKMPAAGLALLMLSASLAGCGSGGNTDGEGTQSGESMENTGTQTGTEEQDQGAEVQMPALPDNTLHITVRVPNFGTDPQGTQGQQMWQDMMEAYLGIKLDIDWIYTPWADYTANEKVLIQTGDIPDVTTYTQDSYINDFGADGLVLNIMDYWDYMTYYPQYVENTMGGVDFITNQEGASYYFRDGYYNPNNISGAQSFTSFGYRFDLLKKHDLKPAETLEEFTELCAKLKSLIDSGEIEADYVIDRTHDAHPLYRGFVGIFHTWDTTYWNGNEWSFGPIEDNFREMLRYLNGLYEAGYIDPEFTTDKMERCNEKALNNGFIVAPCGWAGNARNWNMQKNNPEMEWGNAFLPREEKYGTPWKWGSKMPGKSLSSRYGIIINADAEYPEWIVKMIDYQYSDEMVLAMNMGVFGDTYEQAEDGTYYFTEKIMGTEVPTQTAADLGIMAYGACRPGVCFIPQMFDADTGLLTPEPWWNAEDGYYEGQYWVETGKLGGPDSISPFDTPPVTRLSDSEATERALMTAACETYVIEECQKFITGEYDIDDDARWSSYVDGVKNQAADFDGIFRIMNEKTIR